MLEGARLRWALWRNRLIGSPGLRDLANWFPPARLPARRYARELFDLSAGFVYAQIAQALIEGGLLVRLQDGPTSIAEAAEIADLTPDAAETLLRAGASLHLTEQVGTVWVLGSRGAALAASPGVAEMIRHHRLLYADLADPLAMLRRTGEGRLASLWRYDCQARSKDVQAYTALMAASQPMVAGQALASYRFDKHRRLLDVGGGTGRFLEQVATRAPNLWLGLFDRPEVVEYTRLGSRAVIHPGDFHTDALPSGYDLITFVRVLHDHDDAAASRLIAKACSALPPSGRVLIVEPLAETRGAEPMGHAYFGMYLAAMRSGRPRNAREYKAMLRHAGFAKAWRVATPLPLVASLIVGQK